MGGGGPVVFYWPHHRPGPPHRHGPPSLIISPLSLYFHVLPTAVEGIPTPPQDGEVSLELSLELSIIKVYSDATLGGRGGMLR